MTLDSMIARTRRHAERLFRSSCVVVRPSSDPVTDADGAVTYPSTTVYRGRCNVRPADLVGLDAQIGERERGVLRCDGRFPHNADIARNDVVTVLTAPYDNRLPGRVFRITTVSDNAWQTVRNVSLEEITP